MGDARDVPRMTERAIIAADGYRLPLDTWPAAPDSDGMDPDRLDPSPAAVILAIHGFDDYALTYRRAARAWADMGLTVYAYDQRGFGRTEGAGIWAGTATYAADAAAAIRLIDQRHPDRPLVVVGHSMGASVAMVALAEQPDLPVDRLVMVAPGIWDFDVMPTWQRWGLDLAEALTPGRIAVGGDVLDITPTDNWWALREMARDPYVLKANRIDTVGGLLRLLADGLAAVPDLPVPALVLYGDREDVVPAGQVALLIDRLDQADVPVATAFYPEGYHMLLRDLGRAAPIGDIASYAIDPTAPLPSAPAALPAWER